MAAKYHIGDDGMPGACRAKSDDSCPKVQAGDSFHGTLEEASAESARRFEEKLGAFVTTQKKEEKAEAPKAEGYTVARYKGYTAADLRKELALWDTENPGEDPTDVEMALEAAEAREAQEAEASEEIYIHPQGKIIKVGADGTVTAFKDGHELKTSATAEKLRAGYGQWKRHTPAQPAVSKAQSEKMIDDLTAATMNISHAEGELHQHYADARIYDEANAEAEGRASYYSGGFTRVQGRNPDPKGYTTYTPTSEQTAAKKALLQKLNDAREARNDAQTAIEEKGLGHRIPDEGNTIRVRTQAQKWLLENEIKGQISDGAWENSTNNPWEDWSNAKVVVDPDNAGRNFNTRRDNYNLTRPDLLEVVGDRMVDDVQTRTGNKDYDEKAMRADLSDLKSIFKTKRRWVDGN